MKKLKQKPLKQRVFDYLMTGATLTPLGSTTMFNSVSVQRRINEMQRQGIPIERIEQKSSLGNPYSVYFLPLEYRTAIKLGTIEHPFTPASADGNKNGG